MTRLGETTQTVVELLVTVLAEDIEVTMRYGPLTIGGVRRGYWPVSLRGVETRVYCALSSDLTIEEQRRRVREACLVDGVFLLNEAGLPQPSLKSLTSYIGYLESEHQRRFGEIGARVPRSVLLPLTEETMLAIVVKLDVASEYYPVAWSIAAEAYGKPDKTRREYTVVTEEKTFRVEVTETQILVRGPV